MEDIEICSHQLENGTCIICGQCVENEYNSNLYSHYHTPTSKQVSTFIRDIQELGLDPDIRDKTIEIYQRSNRNTHRSGKLTQQKFFCIFAACSELGKKRDPKWIARLVGLPLNKMGTALGTFKESTSGIHIADSYIGPLDLLPNYYMDLGLDGSTYKILERIANNIMKICPSLNDRPPQNVAGAILQFFCQNNGIYINGSDPSDKIAELIDCSTTTIGTIVTEISQKYNS